VERGKEGVHACAGTEIHDVLSALRRAPVEGMRDPSEGLARLLGKLI
jgi:hypothetical protein